MELAEAILQALKDEALDTGCAGTRDGEMLSGMLGRIIARVDRLVAPGPAVVSKNGTDRSYEQRLRDSGHLG